MAVPANHISLAELSGLIQDALLSNLAPAYWVVAEIGEMKVHQRGHCYLELVEKSDQRLVAKIRGTIWASVYQKLSQQFEALTGCQLRAGLKVMAYLSVEFHELYGLSVNIKAIDGNYTLGERARKRSETLQKLAAAGLLEKNKALALEVVPQRLAVVSSSTAAGLEDFITQLSKNSYGYRFTVSLFEASMQGESAGSSICSALKKIDAATYDAVILLRGGGGRIDLDCFDELELAETLANLQLPIITGIGHERDETIADLVAHTALKTPTAVAEFLIGRAMRVESYLNQTTDTLNRLATNALHTEYNRLNEQAGALYKQGNRYIQSQRERLNGYTHTLYGLSKAQLKFSAQHLKNLSRLMVSATHNLICQEEAKLNNLACHIELQDPERILARGYTITLDADGKMLTQKPAAGHRITTRTQAFTITSTVDANPHDL